MRRPILLTALIWAALASPAGAMIVPQDNIAGAKIDMSQQKILDVVGDPATTRTRLGGGGGETPITTYNYKRKGIKVLFKPNRSNTANTAFSIQVYRYRKQLTAEGIGIGSTRKAIKSKIAGVKCRRYDPSYAFCLIGSGKVGKVSTVFQLNKRNKVKLIYISKPFDE
jgi:hypothetical protein